MPVDPSIPLSARAPQLDLGSIMTQALQLRQMRDQVQTDNALKAILAEPDAVDPKTGQPSNNALARITRVAPAVGTKMIASKAEVEERQAQSEHAQSETQQARTKAYRDQLSSELATYDEDVKGGKVPLEDAERKLKSNLHDYLYQDASLSAEQRDRNWAKVQQMTPAQLRALAMTADQREKIQEKEREETEEMTHATMGGRDVLVNKLGDVFDPNTRKKLEVYGLVEKEGTALDPTRADMEKRRIALQEKIAAGSASSLDDNDLTFAAELVLNGQPMPNMGYGAAGASARAKVLHKAAQMAGQQSGSAAAGADDAVVRKDVLKSDQAALTTATKQQQSVRQFSQTATGLADKVEALAERVAARGPEAWAKFVQHVKLKVTADEDTKEFLGYVTDLQSENAKIMAGATGSVAQVSAHNQEMMNHMLSGDQPLSEIKGSLKAIREGIRMRNASVDDEVTRQRSQIKGDTAGGGSHAPGALAHPSSKAEYDALPSGAHYAKPGDPPGTYRVKP